MMSVLQIRFLFFILLFYSFTLNLYSISVDSIIDETIDNYSKIKTIQSDIVDNFYSKTKSGKYSGKYYSIGSSTAIYFNKPFRQSILITKDSVYWYFPDDKKIYIGAKLDKADIESFQRENNLTFLNKIDYNFEKKLISNLFSKKIKLTITPKIKRKSKFSGIIAYIHPGLKVITDVEFYDLAGNETIEQHFKNFTKVNGIYLATSVSTIIFTPMGGMETHIKYEHIILNKMVDKEKFDLKIPTENIKVFSLFNP